jgi:hypothetical protein
VALGVGVEGAGVLEVAAVDADAGVLVGGAASAGLLVLSVLEDASDAGVASTKLRLVSESFLKSVSYQPAPLSRNAAAVMRR